MENRAFAWWGRQKLIRSFPILLMRLLLLGTTMLAVVSALSGQPYFPIKVEKKWGLIDGEGEIVLSPTYDGIGEFKQYGYAVMQRAGKVGLLNRWGKEIVSPAYDDLKVLDSLLFAVRDEGEWMVIDLGGKVVLQKGYQRVEVWGSRFLAYRQNEYWGVVDKRGRSIIPPRYDEISFEEGPFFITRLGDDLGLYNASGREVLSNVAREIDLFNDSIFFYREGSQWGAAHADGDQLIPPRFDAYRRISDQYIKLISGKKIFLFSIACGQLITAGEYEEFYAFSKRYIIVKKDRRLGLIDWCGETILSPLYSEIQSYEKGLFRVNLEGRWGVVGPGDRPVIDFQYDYIAPLRSRISLVKKDGLFGIVNYRGEEVVNPTYTRIHLEEGQARAYQQDGTLGGRESLTILRFDTEGRLKSNDQFNQHFQVRITGRPVSVQPARTEEENVYVLEKFEWYYSPEADRWGLRRLADGTVQIDPVFYYIQPEKDLGFTLVGIEKGNRYEFERTTYRMDMVFGLVRNDLGMLVTELEFWDVRFSDFDEGLPLARCTFANGKHGLIDQIGKVVRRDFAFIGQFREGVARMSIQGRLSGSMKPVRSLGKLKAYLQAQATSAVPVDYTEYDQLFQREADLICDNCQWGYIDTCGQVVVPPRYAFAEDFVNDVGIVESEGKWGMVNRQAEELIPCRYDGVEFLENTNNRIVRVSVREPKYGLIDTLGQLAVNAVYDEIGSFSEGRLAVRRNGLWGFVDPNGLEVIPCRFREVQNFSEGLAAVKLGRFWGYIDKQGNTEIDFQYTRAGNFREELAWVYNNEGAGYINRQQEVVIPPAFDRAFDFQQGVARVVVDNKFGLIDRRGRYIDRPRFVDMGPYNRHGLAVVTYGNHNIRYGLLNLRGELITSHPFREIGSFHEGLAAVKLRDGYGFIDTTGRLVIPCEYSKVSAFSEGRAAVQRNGACGYITRSGKEAVSFEFSRCLDFDGGKAVVYKGMRRAGLIDLDGQLVLKPSVNRLLKFREGRGLVRDEEYRFYYITEQADLYDGYYQRASAFNHGVAVVQVEEKWGIINQRGIEIIPPKYDKIESFEDGYAKVRIRGFTGLSNLKGELIVQPSYEYISYAGEGLFRVEQGDRIGYFDVNGNWVWNLTN